MVKPLQFPGSPQPEEPLESPEVLIINALLEAPEGFRPEVYGVSKDMLAGWTKAWQFAEDYQQSTGGPPGRELFSRTFPDFEILGNVNARWAADKLRQAHAEREMKRKVKDALTKIQNGDVDGARDELKGIVAAPSQARPQGMSVFDPRSVADGGRKIAYPSPWDVLNHYINGGIGIGELMYLGARFGQGKSWLLPLYAVVAAEYGATVALLTVEIMKERYISRIHKCMARTDTALQKRLSDPDDKVRMRALGELEERFKLPGAIEVLDPSDAQMNTRLIRTVAGDRQFVFLDHIGLFQNNSGKRAVEDWRVAAEISNAVKETTLEQKCGIVAAAQVNREGESSGYLPPKASQLAGADDLGRDADILIMHRRMGERAMLHHIAKNRDGVNARFYTAFEPATADFHEITKDQALDRARLDGEKVADA